MKIAILSISTRPTLPPDEYGYGGMTRVSWWLAEELVRLEHDIHFFATPRSKPPDDAVLVEYPRALVRSGFDCSARKQATDQSMAMWFAEKWLDKFDVIHDLSHRMPVALFCDGPILATMQNPNPRRRYDRSIRNLVALSPAHAEMYGDVPYVYNGVKDGAVPYSQDKSGPFLLLGVMQPYKGVSETIKAAIKADVPLVLAGHRWDTLYGKACAHLIGKRDKIQYVGEVQGQRKADLISHARAAMLYVQWREPGTIFGIEAMCAGTSIIGSEYGCIPNYVIHGMTGFICKSVNEMADAMLRAHEIEPGQVRFRYLEHFTVQRQAQNYLKLYSRTAGGETW